MKKKGFVFFALPAVAVCFIFALARLEQGRQAEGKRQLEESLRRTAVACYAGEGFYPPDIAYMQRHYGLTYEEESYVVYYDVCGSNLMPDITVLEK